MEQENEMDKGYVIVETESGWVSLPLENEMGEVYDEESLKQWISSNGPVDPVTGEDLPIFEEEESANAYAKQIFESGMPEAESSKPGLEDGPELEGVMKALEDQGPVGMYHGGMMMPDLMVGMDEMSGNPIPPGSNADNVKDDIPAALSDGEYVVPADVVRWHGLKEFVFMREEAKMGLMSMQMEGQIQMIDEEESDEDSEEETHTMPDGTEMPGATHEEYEEEYGECSDCDGEGCDECEEEKEEEMDEKDGYYPSENSYRPKVKIAMMKK
jgi:hypothetical protein